MMKYVAFLAAVLALTACEGPMGPTGPQGPAGPAGTQGLAGAAGADGEDGAGSRLVELIDVPDPLPDGWIAEWHPPVDPAELGLLWLEPPLLGCFWRNVNEANWRPFPNDPDTDDPRCELVITGTRWKVVGYNVIAGTQVAFVIVY